MKATTKKAPTIKQLNKAYAKATPAERRKMIARDALAQIKADTFIACRGTWAEACDADGNYPRYHAELQPFLLKKGVTCTCCGAGAIFLSYVRLANNATSENGSGFCSIQRTTDWPEDNLRLIEIAFEKGCGLCGPRTDVERKAMAFGCAFGNSTNRLNAILKNIAANKEGLFTP